MIRVTDPGTTLAARVILAQLGLTLTISFWVALCQRPPALAVALHISLPWIAVGLAARFPEQLTLFLDSDSRKPLSAAWLLNMIALAVLFRCVRFVDWKQVIWAGCIPGAALFLAALLVEGTWPVKTSVAGLGFVLLFSLGYGYGVACELDTLLDRSSAVVF
jgi:hypothetical protein